MRIQVLLSCMYQSDYSIIQRSNIQTDVLVVNQCNQNWEGSFSFHNKKGEICDAHFIYTTQRGLSRSRNLALRYAKGDICLFCDDDVYYEDDYASIIIDAFDKYSDSDLIAFDMLRNDGYHYLRTNRIRRVGLFGAAKLSSVQLAFRRNKLILSTPFCEIMGSGTGNGGGEENKFLVDCIRKDARIITMPKLICHVEQSNSLWHNGFDELYWVNSGWAGKMIYGKFIGYLYMWYRIIFRVNKIDKDHSILKITCWLHRGYFQNRTVN